MGLRYKIPFADSEKNSYLVEVYREDYEGPVTELTGAPSCFVVSTSNEDFVYNPLRLTTATLTVLEDDLLTDLYSINNQYAKVRFLKNSVLEWTGYIKPEQYTQPYVPTAEPVSVECVGALSTLEHIEYKSLTTEGVVTMWRLLKHLIEASAGGYRGVFMPWVYGSSATDTGNVFEEMRLIENNFLKEEMNLLEVLENVCKFLNWTVYDVAGCIYFVDHDWKGEYRKFDEALNVYTVVQPVEKTIQDIGFNGSGRNTFDIVKGYNKATVKAINNVFDNPIKDEEFELCEKYANGEYLVKTYQSGKEAHAVRKQFLKPVFWNVWTYDKTGNMLQDDTLKTYTIEQLNQVFGAVLMREADYQCVSKNDETPAEGVTDFNFDDVVQVRIAETSSAQLPVIGVALPILKMKGEVAVYSDCAISVDGTFEAFYDDELAGPVGKVSELSRNVTVVVSCGGKYFNGSVWVDSYASFPVEVDESGKIKSNRTPFTPYKDISGYVIPMEFFVGAPEITIFAPVWFDENNTHYITGVKINGLKFGYAKKEGIVEEGENGDRLYQNVVNENYMSEADEISFGVSSYNADGASYSKVLLGEGWLTDNLYSKVVEEFVRPEKLMIRRIVNRYGETKCKLTEDICMTADITPITIVKERTVKDKAFLLTGMELDYEQNRLTVQIQEDAQ